MSLMEKYIAKDNIRISTKESNLKHKCVKHFLECQYLTNHRDFGVKHSCHDDIYKPPARKDVPVNESHEFKVNIRFANGDVFPIYVKDENTTIKQLKEQIEHEYDYPKL